MLELDSLVLYVSNLSTSVLFYRNILACEEQALSPTFVSFPISPSFNIELKEIENGDERRILTLSELSLKVSDVASLKRMLKRWLAAGGELTQPITQAVYGSTFVIADPDGHRIRLWCPANTVQG
ncbi:VOC family protein [Veronia pacifica]|uniref:VOC domain-containing protein n=1 Tax=Veronia pacifica TaxID=1080227 RepID=A0A1C3ED57_9GAMM|nr:VOC family protein [Veronia pacifica]ODA31144.1 hypothetical protein A8L45_17985 [Veronia pacifica]